jgi:hypothetical protein
MSEILFRARHQRELVTVALATNADLVALTGSVGCAVDMLEFWRLIAVRSVLAVAVYAVGWRLLRASIWITSPVTVVDHALGSIRTASGSGYSLGVPGRPVLEPELEEAIVAALRSWGCSHVRRIPSNMTAPGRQSKRTLMAAEK